MPSAVTKPALTRVGEADAETDELSQLAYSRTAESTVVYKDDDPDDHDSNEGEGTGVTASHLIDSRQPVSAGSARAEGYPRRRFNG